MLRPYKNSNSHISLPSWPRHCPITLEAAPCTVSTWNDSVCKVCTVSIVCAHCKTISHQGVALFLGSPQWRLALHKLAMHTTIIVVRCILQYIPQTLSTLQSHLRFHPPMGPVVLSCIALSDPPPSSVLVSPLTEWQGSHMTCWTAHALTRVHTRTHMHSHVYTHTHTHRHALTHVYMYKSRELLTGKQLSTSSLAGMLLWPILPPQIPPAIVFL